MVALALTFKAPLTIPSGTSMDALEACWFFNHYCANIKLEKDTLCILFLRGVLTWSTTLNAFSVMTFEKGKLSNKDMQGIRLGNFREFVTVRVFKTYDSMTTF
jgi:hypothetical protein